MSGETVLPQLPVETPAFALQVAFDAASDVA